MFPADPAENVRKNGLEPHFLTSNVRNVDGLSQHINIQVTLYDSNMGYFSYWHDVGPSSATTARARTLLASAPAAAEAKKKKNQTTFSACCLIKRRLEP